MLDAKSGIARWASWGRVILQLCGPKFTRFWPPHRLDNCGHFTYYLPFVYMKKRTLSTGYLPTSSCPHSYWMTPELRGFSDWFPSSFLVPPYMALHGVRLLVSHNKICGVRKFYIVKHYPFILVQLNKYQTYLYLLELSHQMINVYLLISVIFYPLLTVLSCCLEHKIVLHI